MSARAMVLGGEASYSLYLLHYWVLHTVTQPRVYSLAWPWRTFWLVVAMMFAIWLSRTVYLLFERPAMKFFRSGGTFLRLAGPKQQPAAKR